MDLTFEQQIAWSNLQEAQRKYNECFRLAWSAANDPKATKKERQTLAEAEGKAAGELNEAREVWYTLMN